MGYEDPPTTINGNNNNNNGSTSGGSSGGGGTSKSAAQLKAEREQRNKYKKIYTSYVFGKTTLGLQGLTKEQRKTVTNIINKAAKTGLGTTWLTNQIIKQTPKAWLKSAEGTKRVQDAKDSFESVFGFEPQKGNTALLALVKQYAKNPGMSTAQLEKKMEQTKRFQGEFGDLYKAYVAGTPGAANETLASRVESFKEYRTAFAKTMAGIKGMTAEQIALEENMLFSAGVAKEDFADRWDNYQSNKQSYLDLMGRSLTDVDRQAILYGGDAGAASLRAQVAAATTANTLYQTGKTGYKSLFGTDVSQTEKEKLLSGDSATQQAMQRASDVASTVSESAGSYNWMTGQNVSAEQKKELLYQGEGATGIYDALKRAFNVQTSYSKSELAGFGLSKNDAGTIIQTGV